MPALKELGLSISKVGKETWVFVDPEGDNKAKVGIDAAKSLQALARHVSERKFLEKQAAIIISKIDNPTLPSSTRIMIYELKK